MMGCLETIPHIFSERNYLIKIYSVFAKPIENIFIIILQLAYETKLYGVLLKAQNMCNIDSY